MDVTPLAASEPSPNHLLEHRPEARTVRVEDLLDEVKRGRIRVPEFQRLFRWDRENARELLDSIYLGFPIGTLLLWETSAEAQQISFGPIDIVAPPRSDAWWVVDGQQRVGSLVRVLLAPHPSIDEFALYFDLDGSKLVPASAIAKSPENDPSRWLPLAVVQDSEQLFHWMLEQHPKPARRDLAIRVGKRIREYEIPTYIVHTDNEETLRQIFGRTNNGGKPLKPDEVFDALHSARSSNKPSRISDIVDDLRSLGFGQVEAKILYRLLRVLAGADVTERGGRGGLRLSGEEARAAYASTAAAAKAVVQFLRTDVGIPHYSLLPYKQPLVTLGKFFHHHPSPSPRSRQLLARWLWRGALNGAHRGDTVSTRRALDQIDGDDEERSVQRMLKQVDLEPAVWPSAMDAFNFRFAHGKLQTLALASMNPMDLFGGGRIEPALIFDDPSGELPLPDIVASASGTWAHSVANRLLHARRSGLRRALAFTVDADVLASHAVSGEAHSALISGDVERFLELRARAIDAHFREFFARKAQWHETDRPSVAALVISDDD
jgi:hypothetical protein